MNAGHPYARPESIPQPQQAQSFHIPISQSAQLYQPYNALPYPHQDPSPPNRRGPNRSSRVSEEEEGRSRNAVAQRRHREKRKAHLRALEEAVARHDLEMEAAAQHIHSLTYRLQSTPPNEAAARLLADNNFLRAENAEFRRHLHAYRAHFGELQPHQLDVAVEAGSFYSPPEEDRDNSPPTKRAEPRPEHGQVEQTEFTRHSPPRLPGIEYGLRHPQVQESMPSMPSTATSISAMSTSSSFPLPHGMPQYQTPVSHSHRNLHSASSAPSTSPFVHSGSYHNDLHHCTPQTSHSDLSIQSLPYQHHTTHETPQMTNEPELDEHHYNPTMYPTTADQPHPQSLPRVGQMLIPSGPGSSNWQGTYRPQGDETWTGQAGGYGVNYPQETEEWVGEEVD